MTKNVCYDEIVNFDYRRMKKMMKKKVILSIAAAAAIVAANPVLNKAHAATLTPSTQEKVYVYQGNDLNSFIEGVLNKMGFTSFNTVKQPVQAQTATPMQQQPVNTTAPVKQQPVSTITTQSTGTLSAYEQKVVDLTNQERAKNGLTALKVDSTLSKMAHEKSRDMSANNYFSHTSPTYGSPFDMMKSYGITYSYAGENIAMGQQTPEEVVNAWMNSAGHRANILNANYNYIGVGYVSKGNYWTQEFIGK
jgi:uncharacterized YkwD family protein